jgi:serine/threonine protein phosphatase 1
VPEGQRVYAIGDIHGRRDLLDELLDDIRKDCLGTQQTVVIVFVGDYVDRGPDSKGVIERLLNLPPPLQGKFLRGNHDQALLDFIEDPLRYETWCDFGADETLTSYGVRRRATIRPTHWLRRGSGLHALFRPSICGFSNHCFCRASLGDYFFAHAGVRPGTPLDEQKEEDLLWIREEFLRSSEDFGKVVVHGHTPTDSPVKRANRIGIDTGAYLTGRLTAVALEGHSQRFLQPGAGRVKLTVTN